MDLFALIMWNEYINNFRLFFENDQKSKFITVTDVGQCLEVKNSQIMETNTAAVFTSLPHNTIINFIKSTTSPIFDPTGGGGGEVKKKKKIKFFFKKI